jgi:hypothetical protein
VIELPSWRGTSDDPARVIALIDAWATSPALGELVAAFGGHRALADPLGWLDEFSASRWDFRAGRERNLAAIPELTRNQESLVLDLAPELGFSGQETPTHLDFDVVIMTGGMVRAGIVKPRHVTALLDNGLTASEIVFLGGFRPFAGDEHAVAVALGVEGDNEFASMVSGMRLAFAPLGEAVVSGDVVSPGNASWCEQRWSVAGRTLSVLAAPSSDPVSRRANSADTFTFWAERQGEKRPRVLVVTTPIYVPYQGALAVELLGLHYGFEVETVATSASAGELGEHSQAFSPANHLQELRSAIRSMRSLRAALVRL